MNINMYGKFCVVFSHPLMNNQRKKNLSNRFVNLHRSVILFLFQLLAYYFHLHFIILNINTNFNFETPTPNEYYSFHKTNGHLKIKIEVTILIQSAELTTCCLF